MSTESGSENIVIAAMYHFVRLADYEAMKAPLLAFCLDKDIKGTILLAEEGLNSTIAGSREGIDALLHYLRADPRLAGLTHKESYADEVPFYRMKIKLKKEIVTMGVPDTDPNELNGTRVDAEQWNELISDPEVLVIDTRNHYEVGIGTFENAISPETKTFREFPAYVKQVLNPEKHKKIAMFCTGGIRCEKATNYLMKQGFDEVYHLEGGILKYLETVKPGESLWRGECFVFDGRVAVDENLAQGRYIQCFACRMPLSEEDRNSTHYKKGISCPHCVGKISDDKKTRLQQRQRQIELAAHRNERHIGITAEQARPGRQARPPL